MPYFKSAGPGFSSCPLQQISLVSRHMLMAVLIGCSYEFFLQLQAVNCGLPRRGKASVLGKYFEFDLTPFVFFFFCCFVLL